MVFSWECGSIRPPSKRCASWVYCYAVSQRAAARRRFREHDPHREYLDSGDGIDLPEPESGQLRLL